MNIQQVKEMAASSGKEIHFVGRKSTQTKWINDIKNNRRPNPEKFFVMEGIWLHQQVLNSGIEIHSFIVCPELIYTEEGVSLTQHFIKLAKHVYVMESPDAFLRISEKDKPHGLVSVCTYKRFTLQDIPLKDRNLLVVVDGVEIPGNAGTITRSVDGIGGDGVVFCKREGSVRLNHPKLIRASQCTCFHVPLVEDETANIIAWLHANNFEIYLLDTAATHEYHQFSYNRRTAIVAGNERHGISEIWYKHPHKKIGIPMLGRIDSLNVGIATSIVLYEAGLKQKGHIKYNRSEEVV